MARPTTICAILIARRKPEEIKGVLTNLVNQDRVPDEIVVIDADPEGSSAVLAEFPSEVVRYVCPGEEMSIAAARARGVDETSSEVIVFNREFARFERYTALDLILDILRDDTIGGTSFVVRDAGTRDLELLDYPGNSAIRVEEARDVSAFTRSIFAVRRTAFEAAGGLDLLVGDGEQELDLAYRVLNAGFRIRYAPSILVNHRGASAHQALMPWSYDQVRDHVYLAAKLLPMGTNVAHGVLWTLASLAQSLPRKEVGDWWQGLRALWSEGLWAEAAAYQKAHPMTKECQAYLAKNEGRLIF
jgi:GT2 family glycosyltransferase